MVRKSMSAERMSSITCRTSRFSVSVVWGLQLPTSSTSRRGGYSYGFDLRLGPVRLDHVGTLKELATEKHDLKDSTQTVDSTGKDVVISNPPRADLADRHGLSGTRVGDRVV